MAEEDPIAELLELENLFLEEDVIRLLAYNAVSKECQIKVFPDGKEPICRSDFINASHVDWTAEKGLSIYIAPFQSEADNLRLKKSDQVMICYEHDRFGLEARRLKFLGEEEVYGNKAFRLSLPKIYQVVGRRKLVRHVVPSSMPCSITATRKHKFGNKVIKGKLVDIHAKGFCFSAIAKEVSFEKGDQIKLAMDTRREHFGVIHTIVKILSKAQHRKTGGGSIKEHVFYGCQVLSVHNPHMLELYVDEIKNKETKIRQKEQTNQLVKDMYEKIRKKKRAQSRQ
ncbi:MAG: hypothetical protein HQL69_05240 [Magnetococcales bacterium]|nr:hypothetical protein [Magnetococcales bacterium]